MKINVIRPMSLEDVQKVIQNEKAREQGRPLVRIYPETKKSDTRANEKGHAGEDCLRAAEGSDGFESSLSRVMAGERKKGLRSYERYPELSREQLIDMFRKNI